jgi:DNA-binding transcriptional LysR family regulator
MDGDGLQHAICEIMDWGDLKHFLAVARQGGLTEAARVLKTSAATVGRRIAVLENSLGVRLFDRKQTGYTLTETGESLFQKTQDVEEAIFSVEREAFGRDLRPTGRVRVTTSSEIAATWIAPSIPAFRLAYPGIVLEIVESPDVVNLTRREADVALRTVRPARGDFIIRRVASWNFALYASQAYAAAHGIKPGLTDLSNAEIISWTEECAHFVGGAWLAEHARGAKIVLTTNSRRIQVAACKAGAGLAVLPCATADRDQNLIRLLPSEQVIERQLWLVTHRDLVRTARVRAVMDFLANLARANSRGGKSPQLCPPSSGSVRRPRAARRPNPKTHR